MRLLLLNCSILFMSLTTSVWAGNNSFLHPIFYQQLSDINNNFFYVIKPNSIYYEDSTTDYTKSIQCVLLENKEYYIKLVCDGCHDKDCSSPSKKQHLFSLSKNKTADNNYIISHKIMDEINNVILEETLVNDGLITIPPY